MNTPDPLLGVPSALGLGLPADATDRLVRLGSLLRERAVPLGLISSQDSSRIMERHVLDSLRAAVAVGEGDTTAYDLGAGAGLPGIVVAIATPSLAVRLVEMRRRRAAFLELAIAVLELANVAVVQARIETLQDPVDLCFARALAPLRESWRHARRLLQPGGRLVYFAGRNSDVPRLPDAREVRVLRTPVLESAGPLVIMTR